jgi:hypothetical protein
LNQTEGAFAKIPHGRYINFISEFLTHEKGATREEAVSAWKKLKETDVPKIIVLGLKILPREPRVNFELQH